MNKKLFISFKVRHKKLRLTDMTETERVETADSATKYAVSLLNRKNGKI